MKYAMLVMMVLAGCDNRTYKGKSISEWVALTKDADGSTSWQAKVEVCNAPGVPEFDQIAEDMWNDKTPLTQYRMVAMTNNAVADKHRAEFIQYINTNPSFKEFPHEIVSYVEQYDAETLQAMSSTVEKLCDDRGRERLRDALKSWGK